tara:strand:+ start:1817 stop:2197 length:381 start_codon:yes stop_codon:yes gene_type:complete
MESVKTFRAKVTDELEWDYPAALVAVRAYSESSQNTGVSSDCREGYVLESTLIEAISYKANFWPSVQSQIDGKKSRPLINLHSDGDKDLFNVDLEHEESLQVIESDSSAIDKMFKLIELDVVRRFK